MMNKFLQFLLSSQIKTTVKRKLYDDSGVPLASESLQKTVKKPTSVLAPSSQAIMKSGLQRPSTLAPAIKKSKTAGTFWK